MKKRLFGFVEDGSNRLRAEIKAQVWLKYKVELSMAKGFWEKRAIRDKMELEIEARIKELASPYALWSSVGW